MVHLLHRLYGVDAPGGGNRNRSEYMGGGGGAQDTVMRDAQHPYVRTSCNDVVDKATNRCEWKSWITLCACTGRT